MEAEALIRIMRPSVAMSIQDMGRLGLMWQGHSRSGAMDLASLALTNRCAGNPDGAAVLELGPGRVVLEVFAIGAIAFGGAARDGAPWWEAVEVSPGDRFDLGPASDGVWSYLALAGGVDSPKTMGSRSANVREGIGRWITKGDTVQAGSGRVVTPQRPKALPPMSGNVRVFGDFSGSWRIGERCDRMGYSLTSDRPMKHGHGGQPSEPLVPGCIQCLPSGDAIALMAEAPTVGGYPVAGVLHSEDLRLVAQTRPGGEIDFVPADG